MTEYYTTLEGRKIQRGSRGYNLTREHMDENRKHMDENRKQVKIESDIRKIIDKRKERPHVMERDPTSRKWIIKELKIDCPPVLIGEIAHYIYQNYDEKK